MKIYPTITTTNGADWRSQIKEINKIGLKEVCFFPTVSPKSERKKIYKSLEKSTVKKIPLVHLRTDMNIDEMKYLIKNYNTEVFNIHAQCYHRLEYDLSKYKDIIFVENQFKKWQDNELERFAGICLDISHLEDARKLKLPIYHYFIDILENYSCGCGHISAIRKRGWLYHEKDIHYSYHSYNLLEEFDYLKKYKKYLPEILALELENSISEQLQAKEYIEKLLNIDK